MLKLCFRRPRHHHSFKMTDLPYAVEAQVSLSPRELQLLRDLYTKELPSPRLQTKFNYAWGLVRSSDRLDQAEGVKLLHEIYSESPARRRECLYYLALGNYKMGKYREAKKFNETLLKLEESNPQALSLRTLINDKVQTEGLVGMGLVGGAVILVAGIASAIFSKRRN